MQVDTDPEQGIESNETIQNEPVTNPETKPRTIERENTIARRQRIEDEKDMFKFLGDARSATIVISAVMLLGVLAFLAGGVVTNYRLLKLFLTVYYSVSVMMVIFGMISIYKYNPSGITIYTVFFIVNALLAILFSLNSIIIHSEDLLQHCNTDFNDCKPRDEYVQIIFGVLGILFFVISSFIVLRFYKRFRAKYCQWKAYYSQTEGSPNFYHWCYKNEINPVQHKMELLLDDQELFLPHVKKSLIEIFLKYDADKDGLLNDQELDKFVLETSGHVFSETEKQELLYFDNKSGPNNPQQTTWGPTTKEPLESNQKHTTEIKKL
ncbi:hypothetical protein HDV06_003438 [Boothiomyces sp. JEL0866]|nr:hypothetical protein HDV06_003391 [Boothiomyces sp. JEL0866]KAJ3325668.1 hypothetical protein HDV06_003438 [Boothiomyces sp. JEL0866]